jgi:hypothetical protein
MPAIAHDPQQVESALANAPVSVFQLNARLREPPMSQAGPSERKAAPPSGEGRGRQTGTLLSPVLEEKYRTLLSEPCGSVGQRII